MNHIQSVTDPEVSWCKQTLNTIDFYFKTLDQAALNGLFQDKKIPCEACIRFSAQALLNNLEVDDD